jgi:hypothetical protein
LSWAKKKWGKEALKRDLGPEKKHPAASPKPKDKKSLLLQRLKDDVVILSKNFIAQTKPAVAIVDERDSQSWVALWSEKGRNNNVGINNNFKHIGSGYFLGC